MNIEKIKLFHHPTCSKSNAVLNYLIENKIDFELIDFIKNPLSITDLKSIVNLLQIAVQALFRENEKLFQEKLAGQNFSDEEWMKILLDNPELLQRPILLKGNSAIIARPLEKAIAFLQE